MTGYIIRRLPDPEWAIIGRNRLNERRLVSFYIEGNTFSGIQNDLKIRPKAASFVKRNKEEPIYVVLYNDHKNEFHCLFLFTLSFKKMPLSENLKPVLCICRCVGKTSVKRHWKKILEFIFESSKMIYSLKKNQYIGLEEEQ